MALTKGCSVKGCDAKTDYYDKTWDELTNRSASGVATTVWVCPEHKEKFYASNRS